MLVEQINALSVLENEFNWCHDYLSSHHQALSTQRVPNKRQSNTQYLSIVTYLSSTIDLEYLQLVKC